MIDNPRAMLRTGAALALVLSLSSACAQEVILLPGELEPGAEAPAMGGTLSDQDVTTALVAGSDNSAASLNGGNQWIANRAGGVPVTHITNRTGAAVFVPMRTAGEYQAAVTALAEQGIDVAQGCPAQNVTACGQTIAMGYGEVGWSNTAPLTPGGSATVVCESSGDWTVTAAACPTPPPRCTPGRMGPACISMIYRSGLDLVATNAGSAAQCADWCSGQGCVEGWYFAAHTAWLPPGNCFGSLGAGSAELAVCGSQAITCN